MRPEHYRSHAECSHVPIISNPQYLSCLLRNKTVAFSSCDGLAAIKISIDSSALHRRLLHLNNERKVKGSSKAITPLALWERPLRKRRTNESGRLGLLVCASMIVALWLLMGGCDGEQQNNSAQDKDSVW